MKISLKNYFDMNFEYQKPVPRPIYRKVEGSPSAEMRKWLFEQQIEKKFKKSNNKIVF